MNVTKAGAARNACCAVVGRHNTDCNRNVQANCALRLQPVVEVCYSSPLLKISIASAVSPVEEKPPS